MEKTSKENNWLSKVKHFFVNIGRLFAKLWKYYSTYEKCWLISICTIGIFLGILFPEDPNQPSWLRAVEIIAIVGGCSCELLLSKQSKWAFVVSFFLYDITQTIVYVTNGFYISALFELIFWMPILWISFYMWGKQTDSDNKTLTVVKGVDYTRDLLIFVGVLFISVLTGALFTYIGGIFEGISDYWYLDALANAFSVCNGLFLILRFREQWIPWIGVALVEAILWTLSGQYIMLVLSLGYLMNSIYGFIMWRKYIRTHSEPTIVDTNFHLHKINKNRVAHSDDENYEKIENINNCDYDNTNDSDNNYIKHNDNEILKHNVNKNESNNVNFEN